ncbi:hypothetical protein J4418_01015 [Candidatus Woesearchaeota archaeon]|nr:hypothetical protein [Candidatus Woesearchaeota archaeon]
MGLFNWGKKKEETENISNVSNVNTLPEPPSIENAQLPLPSKKSTQRFPRMPITKSLLVSKNFEKDIYGEEKERLNQRNMLEVIQPLFVRGPQFQNMIIDLIESKVELKKAENFTTKFREIHELKEISFEDLRKNIEIIQHKLIFMDKSLFK